MNTNTADATWIVLKESVRGAAHLRGKQPNQDFMLEYRPTADELYPSNQLLMVAVSDGHGSAKSFRSDIGSKAAADAAAVAVAGSVRNLYDRMASGDVSILSNLKREAEERLPQVITKLWQQSIDEHVKQKPFTRSELELLRDKEGSVDARRVRRAYGTTLLVVILLDVALICIQIGDGDIVGVSPAGEAQRLMPNDPQLFANETTSLSNDEAWRDFRVTFHGIGESPPALILISTDGYSNSFESEQDFLSVGPDILSKIRTKGVEAVRGSLKTWLSETSRRGSGDDITLAIICHREAVSHPSTMFRIDLTSSAQTVDGQPRERREPDELTNSTTKPLVADGDVPRTGNV